MSVEQLPEGGAVESAPLRSDEGSVIEDGLPFDDTLLLQATRRIPAGLSATRTAERERERMGAFDKLRDATASDAPGAEDWLDHLRELLDSPDTTERRWCAAARACGELGIYELAASVAGGLDPESPSGSARATVARESLYRMYARWFEGTDEYEAFVATVPDHPDMPAWLSRHRELYEYAVELLFENLELKPEAAVARLNDPDPAVRAKAASVMPEAVRAKGLGADEALDLVFDLLESEPSPRAFHSALNASLELLELQGRDSEASTAKRERLYAILEDSIDSARFGVELSVARALTKLTWSARVGEDEPPDEGDFGPRWTASLLARLLEDQVLLGVDADVDVIVDVLAALPSVVGSSERLGRAEEIDRAEARGPVLQILANKTLGDGVRAAAADTLVRVAETEDVLDLIRVLGANETSPALRFNVLGAAGRIVRTADPESEAAEKFVSCLLEYVGAPEIDVRRKCLLLLNDEAFQPLIANRNFDPLVKRLTFEDDRELRAMVIALLRANPSTGLLDDILSLPKLENLATSEASLLSQLTDLLTVLTAEEPRDAMRAARVLFKFDEEASRIRRLHSGLELVANLGPLEAGMLEPGDHLEIVRRARELRDAGVRLHETVSRGDEFLRQLADVHIAASLDDAEYGEVEKRHARALFLGDLLNGSADEDLEDDVLGSYGRALELAEEGTRPELAALVRRDRARFLDARGDRTKALKDVRALVFPRGEDGVETGELRPDDVLEASDLRMASRLIAGTPKTEGGRHLREAFDVLELLVARPGWASESPALRMRDLTDLVDLAIRAEDEERLIIADELMAGVPAEALPEDGEEPEPQETGGEPEVLPTVARPAALEPRVWSGLELEPDRAANLRILRSRLDVAMGRPVPPPIEEPADSTQPPSEEDAVSKSDG